MSGTVTVGPREHLAVDRLSGVRPRWCGSVPSRLEGTVQLRAHGDEHRAVVVRSDEGVEVELLDPAYGIAPGQAAVIYDGTRVVGSATIAATRAGLRMTFATGIGSMPGGPSRPAAYDDAVRLVLDELPDLPHLPEVPGRGATANMTGRALAVMADLGADLQPAGWRLTDAPGVDHRRARSLLGQDLDTLEELSDGYTGAFKIQVAGPWTLAATVEKPRGDKVLSDFGARRELAQALAEGLRTTSPTYAGGCRASSGWSCRSTSRRWRRSSAAKVPTASGFGRHRMVHPPEASEALAVGARRDHRRGRRAVGAHLRVRARRWPCCARRAPAGSRSTWALMTAADHDVLGEALEAGEIGRARRRPGPGPGRRSHRHGDHRAGAALARHARARPGRGGGAARAHPDLRPGRSLAGLVARGPRAAPHRRRQPELSRAGASGPEPGVPERHERPERQDRGHHRDRLLRGGRARRAPRRPAAAGAEVSVYSTGTDPIQAVEGDTTPTQKVEVDGTLDDLDVGSVDAVVVPGGTVNADRIRTEERAQEIVRQALEAGKPLAVICHGPWLLVSAGLARGRRLTSYHSLADDVRNAGGTWVDEEVVVDGSLITSRDPDDLPAFIKALEDALS